MEQLSKLAAKQRLVAVLEREFSETPDFDKEAKAKAFFENVGKALSGWGKKAKETAKGAVEGVKKEVSVMRGKPQEKLKEEAKQGRLLKVLKSKPKAQSKKQAKKILSQDSAKTLADRSKALDKAEKGPLTKKQKRKLMVMDKQTSHSRKRAVAVGGGGLLGLGTLGLMSSSDKTERA